MRTAVKGAAGLESQRRGCRFVGGVGGVVLALLVGIGRVVGEFVDVAVVVVAVAAAAAVVVVAEEVR